MVRNTVFKIPKVIMVKTNQDVIGQRGVMNDADDVRSSRSQNRSS